MRGSSSPPTRCMGSYSLGTRCGTSSTCATSCAPSTCRTGAVSVTRFFFQSGFSCKTGGLVGFRHIGIRDEAGGLSDASLPKTYILYKPNMFFFYGGVGSLAREASGSHQMRHHVQQGLE